MPRVEGSLLEGIDLSLKRECSDGSVNPTILQYWLMHSGKNWAKGDRVTFHQMYPAEAQCLGKFLLGSGSRSAVLTLLLCGERTTGKLNVRLGLDFAHVGSPPGTLEAIKSKDIFSEGGTPNPHARWQRANV